MYFYRRIGVFSALYGKFKRKRNTQEQKVLSYFVLNILSHCNLNCKGCDHFSPIADEYFVCFDDIQRDLKRMSVLTNGNVLRIGVMGGEPLLHPDLLRILKEVRSAFPKTQVELVTNGVLLLKQDDEFWSVCHEIDVMIVTTKYPININYDAIVKIANDKKVRIKYYGTSGVSKKTVYKFTLDVDGKQDGRRSFGHCLHANTCPLLMEGKLYPCTVVPNIIHFNKRFSQRLEVSETDYLDINQVDEGKKILEFLCKPVSFCRYCKTDVMTKGHDWGQSERVVEEWV
jgi:MoaA/NifB/PqqE/SkfB family radical SAM enzyme